MNLDTATLQQVFNALDVEQKGHITVEQFTSALEQFYNSSKSANVLVNTRNRLQRMQSLDVNNIVKALDPTKDGIISFDDFQAAFLEYFTYNELKRKTMNLKVGGRRVSICPEDFATQDYSNVFHESGNDDSGFQENGHREPSMIMSPSSYASNSLHMVPDVSASPYSETQSDLMFTDVDNSFDQIRRQMQDMEDKMESISSKSLAEHEGISARLRDENVRLSASVSVLEERLKEAEARYERDLAGERSHLESLMTRTKRTYESEIEILRGRMNKYEADYSEASLALNKTKLELDSSREEFIRTSQTLNQSKDKILALKEQIEKLSSKESSELKRAIEERDEALHTLKAVTSATGGVHGRHSHVGNIGADAVARLDEMQNIIRRLKDENKKLMLQLKDAEEENWSRSLTIGKDLIADSSSLGIELDNLTKEEVVDLLTKETHTSNELRAYTNKLLEKIMTSHPEMLENKS